MTQNRKACLLSAATLLAAAALSPATRAGESNLRRWTLEDVLLVPDVNEIALSEGGRFALYAAEAADSEAKRTRARLHIVDLKASTQREILSADIAKSLRRIPGSEDWSALLDTGDGVQLYRIDKNGGVEPLLINRDTVPVGKADMSLAIGGGASPHRIGILDYSWSPDGKWLWYAQLKQRSSPARVRFDAEVIPLRNRRRSSIEADVEIFLRGPDGSTTPIVVRPSSDRMALHAAGKVVWKGDEVIFRLEAPDGTPGSLFETRAWNRRQGQMRTLSSERDVQSLAMVRGPDGGALGTSGTGPTLELAETSSDGTRRSFGRFGFTVGDSRAAGYAASSDGRRVVVGTRMLGNPRYGLAVIEANRVREIAIEGSLTNCDFGEKLVQAICVAEGMAQPPRIVRVALETGRITPIVPVSARHEEIAPLDARPRSWINRNGHRLTGFTIMPRDYHPGERYPAILITHGSDADERFADAANQWNYPAQLFAERGYVVLLVNDPSPHQSAELRAAYAAWGRGSGPPDPAEVRRLIWLDGVQGFEDIVKQLADEGLVDSARVGIAGYSRGSQMVNVAISQTGAFRAASSGDGGYLEPAGYMAAAASYNPVYGGAPLSDDFKSYRSFAPSLNADKICTPHLQQVAAASPTQIELFEALHSAGVPSQISFYPGASAASDETHIFYIPGNRLLAMRENIAWFDYWLLGKRDPAMPFRDRLAEWDRMAKSAPERCARREGKP
jgi:dipeptidyl aminopeptidase/acylaminoacyl peptidase